MTLYCSRDLMIPWQQYFDSIKFVIITFTSKQYFTVSLLVLVFCS